MANLPRLEKRRRTTHVRKGKSSEVLKSDNSKTHAQRVLEACALSIFDINSWQVSKRRSQTVEFMFASEFQDWVGRGRSARDIWDPLTSASESNGKPKQGNRWKVVHAWARLAVPLYAAPEFGISFRFATGLLGGWTRQFDHTSTEVPLQRYTGPFADEIRRLRRSWTGKALRDAGMSGSEEEITLFLRHVDKANQRHPWHEVFGLDSSDKEG